MNSNTTDSFAGSTTAHARSISKGSAEPETASAGLSERGFAMLEDPRRNKGTAFSKEERCQYGLDGLLPSSVETLDRQVERVMQHLDAKPTDLERYIYLIGLADRSETLFFRTVMSDPTRFIPILYDPTVGDACLAFGHIYRRARGLYITRDMKGRVAEVLRNWPERDIRFICVSTGGRILGLGDIGANGMGIPIGKLQLYTACAAVPPAGLLPVLLDIGTSNDALRADPLYLGLREKPPSERELDELTEEFVQAVQQVFPGCCIHFEDWKGTDAIRMLNRYSERVLCYNDDIQGTASIVLAGLTTALKIVDSPLTEQRILFLGAGSAGIGIASMLVFAMERRGLSQDAARARIAMFDVNGLLESSRTGLSEEREDDGTSVESAHRLDDPLVESSTLGADTNEDGRLECFDALGKVFSRGRPCVQIPVAPTRGPTAMLFTPVGCSFPMSLSTARHFTPDRRTTSTSSPPSGWPHT